MRSGERLKIQNVVILDHLHKKLCQIQEANSQGKRNGSTRRRCSVTTAGTLAILQLIVDSVKALM